jgi:hypothetical protein
MSATPNAHKRHSLRKLMKYLESLNSQPVHKLLDPSQEQENRQT